MNDIVRLIKDISLQIGLIWDPAPSPSKNVFYIKDGNGIIINAIYYRVRNSNVGFWGLTENQLNNLNNILNDYTVLLISEEQIYALSKADMQIIQTNLKLNNDGDYKINESNLAKLTCKVYQL